jgi:hypothetical protein
MADTNTFSIEMTERQLATIISGLLFSCSVNVVCEQNKQYQKELYKIAKSLRTIKPDIQLPSVNFIEEDAYEDEISSQIIKDFEGNIEVVVIDKV